MALKIPPLPQNSSLSRLLPFNTWPHSLPLFPLYPLFQPFLPLWWTQTLWACFHLSTSVLAVPSVWTTLPSGVLCLVCTLIFKCHLNGGENKLQLKWFCSLLYLQSLDWGLFWWHLSTSFLTWLLPSTLQVFWQPQLSFVWLWQFSGWNIRLRPDQWCHFASLPPHPSLQYTRNELDQGWSCDSIRADEMWWYFSDLWEKNTIALFHWTWS